MDLVTEIAPSPVRPLAGDRRRDHRLPPAIAGPMPAADLAALGDEILMARIAAGDDQALAALYGRYARAVVAVALRIVGDLPAAEEVLQDAFLRVWQQGATYHASRGTFAAWVMSIARNLAVDELRRRGSRPRPIPGGDPEPILVALPDERQDVERAAWSAVLRPMLAEALTRLTPAQRQAVELTYLQGLTHREAAAAVGAPVGTIKTRVQLGVRKLRAQLLLSGVEAA